MESAIESAKKTCDDGTTQECAAAWDEVCDNCNGTVTNLDALPNLLGCPL